MGAFKVEPWDHEIHGLVPAETLSQHTEFTNLLNFGRSRRPRFHWASKRAIDLLFASVAILILSPLLLLIALSIRIESPGQILFRQGRIGERLRLFQILKFRTMYEGVAATPNVVVDVDGTMRRPRLDEDTRLTRVGRFLRRWSLDELPQLFNILIGEMSLVGPRPLTVEESLAIPREALIRYSVPAGLTGPSQIQNREASGTPQRFGPDIDYVADPSLRKDLYYIVRTMGKFRQP